MNILIFIAKSKRKSFYSTENLFYNIRAFIAVVGLTFKTPKIRTLLFIDIVGHFLWNFLTYFLSLIILTKIKIVLVGMAILRRK